MPVLRRPKWSLLLLLRHHPVNEREKKESLVGARSVCLVIPTCISLFYECLASLLSQFFAMPKAHFSFGCISSQCQKVAPARFVLHDSVCSIFFCSYPSLSNIQGSPCSNFLTGRVCFTMTKHVTYVVCILYRDITALGLCHLLERA